MRLVRPPDEKEFAACRWSRRRGSTRRRALAPNSVKARSFSVHAGFNPRPASKQDSPRFTQNTRSPTATGVLICGLSFVLIAAGSGLIKPSALNSWSRPPLFSVAMSSLSPLMIGVGTLKSPAVRGFSDHSCRPVAASHPHSSSCVWPIICRTPPNLAAMNDPWPWAPPGARQ
jgi:hypothetical protein